MSKTLYGLVSPSETENLVAAISYNKERLIEYYNILKSVDNDINLIVAVIDVDLEEKVLTLFGKSEVTKL